MKNKKLLSLVLALVMCLGILSGCGGQTPVDDQQGDTPLQTNTPAPDGNGENDAAPVVASVENIPEMSSTFEVAVLSGSWYDMGYQLGEQYPESIKTVLTWEFADALQMWGSREAIQELVNQMVALCDTYLINDQDGKFTDMIQGTTDALDIPYEEAALIYFGLNDLPPECGVTTSNTTAGSSSYDEEDDRNCSAVLAWGDARADGATGVMGAMNADVAINSLSYMPAIVAFPAHGHGMIKMHGIYGPVANDAGLLVECPGGSTIGGEARQGVWPFLFLGAYCTTVQEAIDFLGDPEDDPSTWVPFPSDMNLCMGDATGDACIYAVNSLARAVRRSGDTKFLSTADGDVLANEAGSYVLANNLYLTENMLDGTLSNVQRDILQYWDDVCPRYWTVDQTLREALANGGITIDTLRRAESHNGYYIPEGWDYDYFPDYNAGRWVPTSIYETLDMPEGLSREEYYGENYDPEVWGAPYTKEESRAVEAWSAGWHSPSWAYDFASTAGLWSPEPIFTSDKTAARNLFDCESRTYWFMKGCQNRLMSDIPNATGTYARMQFYVPMDETDSADGLAEFILSAKAALDEQIWVAQRDMTAANVDIDTANGQVLKSYLEAGKTALANGMSYFNKSFVAQTENERLMYLSRALTSFVEGQCVVQLAQNEPEVLEKDLGISTTVEIQNAIR